MKLIKKDYPFTIIIEDKLSKYSGKMYQSISIGYTSVKNKEATDPKEKYKTDWLRFFDEKDLLKLSSLCENIYRDLKDSKQKPKSETVNDTASYENLDDNLPF
jgi:hypothetical protein